MEKHLDLVNYHKFEEFNTFLAFIMLGFAHIGLIIHGMGGKVIVALVKLHCILYDWMNL